MDGGESGDPMDQFKRNEAISAVADDAILAEEDDDYDELYSNLWFTNDDVKLQSASMPRDSVGLGQSSVKLNQVEQKIGDHNSVGNLNMIGGNEVVNNVNAVSNINTATGGAVVAGAGGGGTVLFVSNLHWWTTDADIEYAIYKYGRVKEVKFFHDKANGKSKGHCLVEFFESHAATACKEGMNGHMFNGRPCVVAYASPYTVKKMGEAQVNRNQQGTQAAAPQQVRRGPAADVGPKPGGSNIATTGNYQGGDGNNRGGYGRGNWGRGNNPGMGNRGPVNPMRNWRRGIGGRGLMGNGGNGFGQGIGAAAPTMHPQLMMNQGFDPKFGGSMGRMGGYEGFPGGPTPPFPGMLPSFPGVAPHVNPAFFGRGMPMNDMGMMPTSGMDGPNMGMWPDPGMGGWGGEEHGGGKAAESSYGEEAASDHQHGEASHDRTGWTNNARDQGYERDAPKEKDTGHDNEWSERRRHDDREMSRERVSGREQSRDRDRGREQSRDRDRGREQSRDRYRGREQSRDRYRGREQSRDRYRGREQSRDRYRGRERYRKRKRDRYKDDRDRYADHHRHRDREAEHEDERERGRSSRSRSKSRLSQEDDHRSRSRDSDSGKRRRLSSE